VAGGGAEPDEVRLGEARGADHVDDASLRGQRREHRGRGGRREVEHALRGGEGGQGIVRDRDAERADAGQDPASSPSAGEPSRSIAPPSLTPSVSATALTRVRPIRPAAPTTTSRISAMPIEPFSRADAV
jgi:hypothetical protein